MIRIYGASDDLVEIEGDVSDELGAFDRPRTIVVGDRTGGIRVIMHYAATEESPGVWRASIEPVDEDVPIPWSVTIGLAEPGYSPLVSIDCPKGTPVMVDGKNLTAGERVE